MQATLKARVIQFLKEVEELDWWTLNPDGADYCSFCKGDIFGHGLGMTVKHTDDCVLGRAAALRGEIENEGAH